MKKYLGAGWCLFLATAVSAVELSTQRNPVVESVGDLVQILESAQDFIQPISPPGDDVYVQKLSVPLPADWNGFSKKVTKYMTAYMDENGLPRYRLLIHEAALTRDRVVSLASTGFEVARIPAPLDYQPALYYQRLIQGGAIFSETMSWIFDPAHTAVEVELIPYTLYAAYEQPALESSPMVAMTSSPPAPPVSTETHPAPLPFTPMIPWSRIHLISRQASGALRKSSVRTT
jgi:hypothetical protein